MASKKVEELVENDDIVLWVGPYYGEVSALVRDTWQQDNGEWRVLLKEFNWADLVVPEGTDIELASE